MPMGEMPAVRQVQTEDGIARLQHRGISLHVCLRSGMRLHVGVLRSEQLLGSVSRQVLHDVGKFATTVIALAGIPFGILIGEHRPHCFKHRFADEVLGCDQLQPFMLAANFIVDGGSDLRICLVQRARHRVILHDVTLSFLTYSFLSS